MSILGEESFHVPEMALDFSEVSLGGVPPPLGKQALDGGCIEAVFHHFGRHAHGDGIGGYVASDHRTGTDHSTVANGHTVQHGDIGPDKDIVAHMGAFGFLILGLAAQRGSVLPRGGVEHGGGGDAVGGMQTQTATEVGTDAAELAYLGIGETGVGRDV